MKKGFKITLWASLGVIIAYGIFVLCSVLYMVSPSEHTQAENIKVGLELGRLAALPSSATEIQADGSDGLFSETVYIKFKAPIEEINQFIADSEGL